MRTTALALTALLAAALLFAAAFVRPIAPGHLATRDLDAPPRGPGLDLEIPLLADWDVVPTAGLVTWDEPLRVTTADGHRVEARLALRYRLGGAAAWPADEIRTQAAPHIGEVLAALTLPELMIPERRRATEQTAAEALTARLPALAGAHLTLQGLTLSPADAGRLRDQAVITLRRRLEQTNEEEIATRAAIETAHLEAARDAEAERTEGRRRIEEARREADRAIAERLGEAEAYARQRRAEADAEHLKLTAEGNAALTRAEAVNDQLLATALQGDAGRLFAAIEAARQFELGDLHLTPDTPDFLRRFGGMEAWRAFFLGGAH